MGFLETDTEVYYWLLGRRYGSVKLEDLIGLIEKGLIRPDTNIEINGMIVEASRIKYLKPHFSLDEVEEPTVIETEPYIYGKDDFTDNVVEFDVSEPNAVMYLDGDSARVVIEPSVIE